MGGHGFSNFSGLPQIFAPNLSNTILEGENKILKLQIGRYLLKCLKYLKDGKSDKIIDHCGYLKNIPNLKKFKYKETKEFLNNWVDLFKLFQKCSYYQLKTIEILIMKESKKIPFSDIWNNIIGIKLQQLADIHTITFTIDFFLKLY